MPRRARLAAILAIPVLAVALSAQQQPPPVQGGQGRAGGRGQANAEQARAKAEAMPRPIDAHDSVWIEELTYLEVRDAMKAGKTTALVLAGSVEQNGPYLPGGKHQIAIRLVAESIARKLGNALVAPIIPLEAGRPDNPNLEWGSLYLTAETYQAVVRDIATSLKSQGFKHVILLGDSGGNTAGMRAVAQELSTAWAGAATIHHIPEYYNWTSKGGVRDFVSSNGITEKQEGIHDEYGLTAVMMAADPKYVRLEERTKAGKTTINGVSIVPKEKTIEMGKKIVEFRANVAVEAIKKALAGVK